MSSKKENLFIAASVLFGIVIISFSWIYSRGLEIQNNRIQSQAQSPIQSAQSDETDHSHNQPSKPVGCGV